MFCSPPPSHAIHAQKIMESVAVFICEDLQSFSVIENEGFTRMVNTLEPHNTIPICKNMAEVVLPKLYTEVKKDQRKTCDQSSAYKSQSEQ